MAIVRAGLTALSMPRVPRGIARGLASPLFRALAEAAPDIIAVVSPPGLLRYVSPAVERVLGRGAETLSSEGLTLVHPDDRQAAGAAFARLLGRETGAERLELRLRDADGAWRWLDVLGTNMLDHADVRGIVLSARDVTARKRAEAARTLLDDLGRTLVGIADVASLTERIAAASLELFGGRRVSVFCVDPRERVLICRAALGASADLMLGQRLAFGSDAPGRAIVLRRVFWTAEALTDPNLAMPDWNRRLLAADHCEVSIGVPLLAGGEAVGALGIVDGAGRRLDDDDVRLLARFADYAGIALQTAQRLEQSDRSRRFAEAIAEISRIIAQTHDFEQIAVAIAKRACDLFAARAATVCRLDRATGSLAGMSVARLGDSGTDRVRTIAYPPGAGLNSVAVREGVSVVSRDVLCDARVLYTPELRARVAENDLGAMMAIPLMDHGRPVGTLGVLDRAGRVFSHDDVRLAEAFAAHAAVAVERARLDEEARVARDFLKSVTENCADAIITSDVEGRVTWTSPSAGEMFGYAPEELIGQPASLLYPGGADEARGLMQRLRVLGRVRNHVTTFRARDGRQVPVSTSLSLLRDGAGTVTGVIGIVKDISDQVRAAQDLATREAAFRLLFAANPLPMWVFDAATLRFLEVNDAAVAHYGYSRDDFAQMTLADVRADADFAELGAEVERETRAGRTALPTKRHRLQSGRVIDVDVLRHPMEFQGRPAILSVLIDVTERGRLETELRQAQKMEAVGRLAGGIAHDFNNLVTVIDGRCELLLGRIAAEDPSRRDLTIIRSSARRASALTSQLLAFSRKQVLQPRRLDLNAVLGDMTAMLRRLIGEDVDLVSEPSGGLWSVVADRTQIEQVVMNLAVNARDAMPRGGRLTITTANVELRDVIVSGDVVAHPGRYVTLRVSDTGHGMDEAVRLRVFEPFFTTKAPGEGTGLGLATVFGIVTQSGGAISVTSEPGAGAVFTVYLPARDDSGPAPTAETARRVPAAGTETILVVEDEPEVRSLACEALRSHGYTVLEASGPGEALLLADAHDTSIDCVVTDVVMPVMSGRDLAALLVERVPGLRVLYMSGYLDAALARHNVLGDDIPLLPKPFSPDDLAHKVRDVLDASRG